MLSVRLGWTGGFIPAHQFFPLIVMGREKPVLSEAEGNLPPCTCATSIANLLMGLAQFRPAPPLLGAGLEHAPVAGSSSCVGALQNPLLSVGTALVALGEFALQSKTDTYYA